MKTSSQRKAAPESLKFDEDIWHVYLPTQFPYGVTQNSTAQLRILYKPSLRTV